MPEQEREQTAGTTAQDDRDQSLSGDSTGTPDAADRNAGNLTAEAELAKLREEKNVWLQSKDKVEAANRLEREVEDLRAQVEAARNRPTYGAVDPRIAQEQQRMEMLQQAIATEQYKAQNGDTQAALVLAALQSQQQMQTQFMAQLQYQQIPTEDHADVQRKMQTNKYGDPAAAYEAVLGERYKRERDSLKKRETDLQESVSKRNQGVVGTGRAIPITANDVAATNGKEWTYAEIEQEKGRLYETEGPEAMRAFASKVYKGLIKMKKSP